MSADRRADLEVHLRGPGNEPIDLWRTLNSHGFSDLAPLQLDEPTRSLSLTLPVSGGRPRRVRIAPGRKDHASLEIGGGAAGPRVRAAIRDAAMRVLHLDHDLSAFYATAEDDGDLAWASAGAGRMLRSPTVFEDVVKTICTTNCSWGLTVTMVNALVIHLGEPAIGATGARTNAFPSAAAMATEPESFYREVVRAGYRAPRFATSPERWPRATWTSSAWETPHATSCPTTRSKGSCSRFPVSGRTQPPTS